MAANQRCRRSRRNHEADRHWLIAVAIHGVVEAALAVTARHSPLAGTRPAVEAAWFAAHVLATELAGRAFLHRRQ